MKKWNLTSEVIEQRFPDEILQDYADSLAHETNRELIGQVTETITYDSESRPKLIYSLYVYIDKLKQSYRLFEIEQIGEDAYPVNLKIIHYTGSEFVPNIPTPKILEDQLDTWIQSKLVGNLISYLIRLSERKS